MANKKITNWIIMICIVAALVFGLVYGDMSSYLGAFRVAETPQTAENTQGNVVQVLP